MEPTTPQHHRPDNIRSVISTIAILLVAPIVAILLTLFVFQSYQVNGESMETALQNNDRLIIWKMPKTWARITGHPYVPHRGDIVVLHDDNLAQYGDAGKQIIKRVIALPGERVVVKDNFVTVYNSQHPEGFQPDKTLPYGVGSVIPDTAGNINLTVPAGHIYVMGDNRGNSLDSRALGPVPIDNVIGKLALRILPFTKMDAF